MGNANILSYILLLILKLVIPTTQLFLNGSGPVQLTSSIDIKLGFSLKFRTCNSGNILHQGNETSYFQVTITATNATNFSTIIFTWSHKNESQTHQLQGEYSFDRNVLVEVDLFITNGQKPVFRVTSPITVNRTITNYSSLMDISNSAKLQLGLGGFIGCIYGGKGVNMSHAVNISQYQNHCPLEDGATCSKRVCPSGFAGKYCDKNINECGSYPCHSHATCVDGVNTYKCICGPQWTGPTCSTFLGSLCTSSPCRNGGLCQESYDRNNYTCICQRGYTGRNCQETFYPCNAQPCLNGGVCYNWTDSAGTFEYNCTCNAGFKGTNCEFNVDDCIGHPCHNGICIDGANSFTCNCNGTGFEGQLCTDDVNECSTIKPCKNNGSCTNTIGGYRCNCKSGFKGRTCEADVLECIKSPCLNNGTCIETFGDYKCDCKFGYTGKNCEININECTSAVCGNGTCIDGVNGYTCNCSAGFTGKHCETNMNECASSPCLNNGTCVDDINGYKCSCLGAFNGTHCETWNNLCVSSPCLNNATCVPTNLTTSGFECNCTGTGYAGPLCQFVPGFCYPNNPCVHGSCKDVGSSYNCTCDSGYEGTNCSKDINECLSSPCQFSGTCHNTPGSYRCTCTPYSTGKNCQTDIYRCEPPCQNEGSCRNNTGIRDTCLCPGGWFGDACERRIDYCSNDKPYCGHGKCENYYSPGSNRAVCVCNEGFTGNNCTTDLDECALGYCKNNVSCTNGVGNYSCTCRNGYGGKNCTENINECASTPCQNNGTCVDELNGYKCQCRFGFNGSQCEIDINWCEPNPCKNDANCTDGIETYNCTCHKGYIGRNCSVDVNECSSNPCQNEGSCVEKSNQTALAENGKLTEDLKTSYVNRHGYICICRPGFNGVNCAVNVDDCSPNPCKNNGTCHDLVNGYNCSCLPGFTGKNCSTNINECASNPCQNNASCTDLVNGYSCTCKARYTGTRCENPINQCNVSKPCLNGGSCSQLGIDYRCQCPVGFTGKNCSLSTTVEFDGNANWTLKAVVKRIDFKFRTTLKNGLLLQILSSSSILYFALNSDGILITDETGTTTTTFTLDSASNGEWHNVSILFDQKSLNFSFDGKDFHYSKGIYNTTSCIFGGPNSIKETYPGFIGCISEAKIDGESAAPGRDGLLRGGSIGTCLWRELCNRKPCKNGGLCYDMWNKYSCKCNRRFFGADCQSVYEAFTFGPALPIKPVQQLANNTSRRRRSVSGQSGSETNFVLSIVNTTFDANSSISLSLRTRASNGILFVLSSNSPNGSQPSVTSYLTLQLINGALFYKYSNMGEVKSQNTGKTVNDGVWHDVHLNKQNLSLDNSVIYTPGVTSDMPANYFYVGGVDNVTFFAGALETRTQYSGCLQAISLNGATLALKPISGGGATQSVNSSNAQSGCNGTDVCGNNPCKNGGNCTDLWNAYKCSCPVGYADDTCSTSGCIARNPCPDNTTCFDLRSGAATCISSTTFDGSKSNATFSSIKVQNSSSLSFSLRTRSSTAIILESGSNSSHFFAVGLNAGRVEIVYRYTGMTSNERITGVRNINDGKWYHIEVRNGTSTSITINSTVDNTNNSALFGENFKMLLDTEGIIVGKNSKHHLGPLFYGNFFRGCFAKLLVGDELFQFNQSINFGLKDGCHSKNPCNQLPCVRGQCIDTFDSFRCDCPAHYSGERCNVTHNVTCGFSPNPCHTSSTCVNLTEPTTRVFSQSGSDLFRCNCASGYTGYLCSTYSICAVNPCKNGTCVVTPGGYRCNCNQGFTGVNCSEVIKNCASNPCQSGTCVVTPGGYRCNCNQGFTGVNCSEVIKNCASDPCQNGGTCVNGQAGYTCKCASSYSGTNCQTSDSKVEMWVGIGIAIAVVIIIIAIILFRYCKGQQGMQGVYSPSRQEKGQVEMASMPPIPPKERLI